MKIKLESSYQQVKIKWLANYRQIKIRGEMPYFIDFFELKIMIWQITGKLKSSYQQIKIKLPAS